MESINNINYSINQHTINKFLQKYEYQYMVCFKLSDFNKKLVKGFELLNKEGTNIDEIYYERIAQLTDYVNNKLNIRNYEDFKKAIAFIEMSEVILDQGIREKDFDCLTEGLYTLKSNLENFE